jgi:hypothetical protein
MNLVSCLLKHLPDWASMLPQQRSLERTITRAIGFHGNTQKDWSADYKMFSRSPWKPRNFFTPFCAKPSRNTGWSD